MEPRGIEPRFAECDSAVIPLDHGPLTRKPILAIASDPSSQRFAPNRPIEARPTGVQPLLPTASGRRELRIEGLSAEVARDLLLRIHTPGEPGSLTSPPKFRDERLSVAMIHPPQIAPAGVPAVFGARR